LILFAGWQEEGHPNSIWQFAAYSIKEGPNDEKDKPDSD
jgi:hypothetical protein